MNQTSKMTKIRVDESYVGQRIDKALTLINKDKSRAYIQLLIENNLVFVNDNPAKASYKLKLDDTIVFGEMASEDSDITAKNIPLDIVYEDSDVLVVNKAQGMVVHPAHGHYEDTLVNALLYHIKDLSTINGVKRPGIVHRIDKDTSGLLLVCKNDKAHQFMAKEIKDHKVERFYLALVTGIIKEPGGTIIAPLKRDVKNRMRMGIDIEEGKAATTHFQVVERYHNHTLVRLKLETGRTHQIRVHMAYIGHPVEGDPLYGRNNKSLYKGGQLLHAERLVFMHPTLKRRLNLFAPLPYYFANIIDQLSR